MEACIVIAKLIGILNSEPIDVYRLHCTSDTYHAVLIDEQLVPVQIVKQNEDLTYVIFY